MTDAPLILFVVGYWRNCSKMPSNAEPIRDCLVIWRWASSEKTSAIFRDMYIYFTTYLYISTYGYLWKWYRLILFQIYCGYIVNVLWKSIVILSRCCYILRYMPRSGLPMIPIDPIAGSRTPSTIHLFTSYIVMVKKLCI